MFLDSNEISQIDYLVEHFQNINVLELSMFTFM